MPQTTPATVDFHGARLIVADIGGIPHVALKPICDALSVDWDAQRLRIRRHAVLNSVTFITKATGADGKSYDMLLLPLDKLNGWLFGISAARVRDPARRERLIQYQRECFDALAAHFSARQQPSAPPAGESAVTRLLDAQAISHARRVALDYFDTFRSAVRNGNTPPDLGQVPDQVLHGLLANALMRQRMLVALDPVNGRMQTSLLPPDAGLVSFERDAACDIADRIPMHRLAEVAAAINERMARLLSAYGHLLKTRHPNRNPQGGQP